jgi:class 3 adenylate cyclase
VLGLVPVALVQFMQETFDKLPLDNRFLYWSLGIFLIALARVTLRYELLDARVAVRRAFIYAGAVGVLTVLAILLGTVRPYAVALLLFPLLYWWPRFDARLNARLYPKRARFPELVRTIGEEIAECATVDDVLDALMRAPARLCDARGSVAFLLRGFQIEKEAIHAVAAPPPTNRSPLVDEPLIQLLMTTRKELFRDRLYVEPQYSNIREECMAGFDRLGADVLLPLLRANRVVGGLAIGPRTTGDTYESAELDALSTVAQQAVQALIRVEATERLRKRELEFADLKRFFPPQVIDQVMARGGAAELRSQRKPVTVFFSDLRGFTAFSDSVEPEELMATLEQYHETMGQRIAEFAGTLERFVGDGLMVFFNDPIEQSDHIERAVRMALAMRSDVRRLREEWTRKSYQIDVGMGIHTGFATCGFVGYEGRRDYGVIGNVTNLAARLSDAAGPGEILISARVQAELRNGFRVEPAGELTLKGFHQAQAAYRLVEFAGARVRE